MLDDLQHTSEVSVFNAPCLIINAISGLTVPANQPPDEGNPHVVIPIRIVSYTPTPPPSVNEVTTLPIVSQRNLSYGGQTVSYGAIPLPKIHMEGYIDTPCIQEDSFYISTIIDTNGIRYMWGEVIAMLFEGRSNSSGVGWERQDPIAYRDPWGRVYQNPRILDYTGSYIDALPERTKFTMTLSV